MLLSTLGASLLANMLASDGVIAASQGQGINRNGYMEWLVLVMQIKKEKEY